MGCRYVYTGLESLNPESISSMNKGQNKLSEVREVIQRGFASGIVLSFGLLVGADGDTNDYLARVPEYLRADPVPSGKPLRGGGVRGGLDRGSRRGHATGKSRKNGRAPSSACCGAWLFAQRDALRSRRRPVA
ncbi:hypothetical protein [Sorangium sp. So ce363]|uniref:hypothetical protein n=1 Tax=Sorangium sp. So ce363 TaxID=3133304 RepID=UPI003F61FA21